MAELHRFPSSAKVVPSPPVERRTLDLSDGAGEFSLIRFQRANAAFGRACDPRIPREWPDGHDAA
jgi:hypothetical protein